MVKNNYVTHEELARAELRMNEEQREARHNLANTVSNLMFSADELKTDNALNKQAINSMTKMLEKIEAKLDLFINSADTKFASKDDHNQNSKRIDNIEKSLGKVNWTVIQAVLLAILALVIKVGIVDKVMGK